MKRFVMAAALSCFLSVSALAGDSPTGGYAPPDPNDPTQSTVRTAPGDVPSVDYANQTADPTLTVVMTILSFLSRF